MQVLVTDTHLTNIANAIRTKSGTTKRYTPAEMAAAILSLTSSAAGETGGTTPPAPPPVPPPVQPPSGRTKVGGFTVTATESGALTGFTLGKIIMALPNHQIVKFRAVIFCPTGLALESMMVSDFANGRAWHKTNAYCSAPTRTVVSGGTNYVMEWEELIDITESTEYRYDDDKSNDKLTYYCCAESKVKAVGDGIEPLTGATLTVEAFV